MADAVVGDEAGLVEDIAGGLGLAGERRADQADGVLRRRRSAARSAVAFCGSPSVSNAFSCTWQPGLAALCLSMASCTPFLMLMPSAASGPVSAPAIAMDTGGHCALPSPAGSAGCSAFGRLDFRAVLVDLHLLDDLQVGLRRFPLTRLWTGCSRQCPAQPNPRYREQIHSVPRDRARFTSGSMFSSASTHQPRSARAAMLRDDHSQRMAVTRDVGRRAPRDRLLNRYQRRVGNTEFTLSPAYRGFPAPPRRRASSSSDDPSRRAGST